MLNNNLLKSLFFVAVLVSVPSFALAAPEPVVTIDNFPDNWGSELVSDGTNTFTGTLTASSGDGVLVAYIISTEYLGPVYTSGECTPVATGTPDLYTYECTVNYDGSPELLSGVTYTMFANWIPEDGPGGDWDAREPFTIGSSPKTFTEDKRCLWEKPENTTWITLSPSEKDGIKGMLLTWVQYGADKVNIKIDDGTGTYPWKISETSNDGHEFLPKVEGWQKVMIKPINHCKDGEYSPAVSYSLYPNGWYNTEK